MDDKRRYSRVPFHATSTLSIGETIDVVELHDISMKGALVRISGDIPIPRGEFCTLSIHLPSSNVTLLFTADAVYRHDDLVGLKFDTVDCDSMIHLRKLLEVNTGDPDRIHDELGFLVGF